MHPKIAISVNKFARAGGMESYMLDLVNGLADRGYRTALYAGGFDENLPEYQKIEPHLVDVKRIPKKLRRIFFNRVYQGLKKPNEALIAHNLVDGATVMICGGTHIGYLKAMQQKPNWLDRLAIARERKSYETAKCIMAHSQMMKTELVQLYGLPEEKVKVIYPPADTERFKRPVNECVNTIRSQYGFAETDTIFLFPSTGHTRKGLNILSEFFEQTQLPVKLAVAGSPLPRPMRNVIELGFCQNMPELYRAADFTIMASQYEPFGLVGVESILSGTAVIFAKNMGCTEVMTSQAGLFFERDQPDSLAEVIYQALVSKHAGTHKIAKPLEVLNFNPNLNVHMQALFDLLSA